VLLRDLAEAADALVHVGLVEDVAEIQALRLPVVHGLPRLEAVDVADHLLDRPESELGHDEAHVLGDEAHEVDDVLGLAREPGAQLGILGRDARRAGVQVADAHHDAAGGDERAGGEAELLGAEQGGDRDVAPRLQLAVGLDRDPAAQVVEDEGLVGLGQAELPGRPACMIEVCGEAPVPPSWPLMSTTSAWPWRRRRRSCRRPPRRPA
jgi:hypothetical protein